MGRRCWGMALVLGLYGCATGSDESPTSGPSVGPGVSTTSMTGGTGTDGTGSGEGTAGSDESTAGLDETAGSDGPPPGMCQGMLGTEPLGGICSDGCDCASGRCFQVSLGSSCSECTSDADCMVGGGPGTCSVASATDPPFARCTQGQLGVMCEPDGMSCQAGLVCSQILDTQGFLPDYFCSECGPSANCAGGGACVPTVDINGGVALGYMYCVAPGTLPDGHLCPLLPDGTGNDTPCASGLCAVTDVAGLGIAEIGVCSPCAQDADCPAGQACQDAQVDENGVVPAMCV